MKKFEYKIATIVPGMEIEKKLNELGAEGWRVVGVLQGALHDDVSHARVLLEKEIEQL